MNLTEILESAGSEILTEATLQRIEEAFNAAVDNRVEERLQLEVDSALMDMDEEHSVKLQKLITAIDEDHTHKLKDVVVSINEDHTAKLKNVVRKYESELNESATTYIDKLTDEIDQYLEAYVEELIPVALVEKAAKNTFASKLLGEAKSVLSVDEKYASSQVREAIKDGATKIKTVSEENEILKRKLSRIKATEYLEERTASLPIAKAQFIKKRLAGKDYQFIKENFAFVEGMYNEKKINTSAINSAPQLPIVDRQVGDEIVTESVDYTDSNNGNPLIDLYMDGMTSRY